MKIRKKILHFAVLLYYVFFVSVFPLTAQEQEVLSVTTEVSPTPQSETENTEIEPEHPQPEPDVTSSPTEESEPSNSPDESQPEEAEKEKERTETAPQEPTPMYPEGEMSHITPTPTHTPTPSIKQDSPIEKVSNSIAESSFVKGVGTQVDSVSNTISKKITSFTAEKAKIHKLRDTVFSINDPIEFIAEKRKEHILHISATSYTGKKYELPYKDSFDQDGSRITIHAPRSMEPGKYELTITDESGQTTTQDFLWGVLALNTHKSVYLPNQNVQIDMAVLDETGEIVCNADVDLEVLFPDGKAQHLTTKEKTIIINDVCGKKEFTLEPDYEANITVENIGTYKLNLTAVTKNGTYTITDSFKVVESVDFDVERESATRLYPVLSYPMNITITANKDFEGIVTDVVPEEFDILPSSEGQEFTNVLKSTDADESAQVKHIFADDTNNLLKPYVGDHTITLGFGEQYGFQELINKIFNKNHIEGHDGIDIDMPIGTSLFATDTGTVEFSGNGDFGKTIIISHTWGKSYYGHLKELLVKEGDDIIRGQEIALSGNSGISTGPHLHFGIKPNAPDATNGYNGMIDPESLISFTSEGKQNDGVVLGAQAKKLFPTKLVTWHVTLKKGEQVKLSYRYKSPINSPAFYRLGKLTMTEQPITEETQSLLSENLLENDETAYSVDEKLEKFKKIQQTEEFQSELARAQTKASHQNSAERKIVFQENRYWQIAVDSVVVSGGITESEVQFGGQQRKVVYVNSNWYAFHNDGGKIYYQKSSNGTSWGGNVDVDSGDSDNYNPSVTSSNNYVFVFWVDDSSEVIEGRRIDTASADAQGTLCQTANQGSIGSTFMPYIASNSDTSVNATYSDSSSDTEFGLFNITGLSGACTATAITTSGIIFGTDLSASDRPILADLSSDYHMLIYQDGSNLKSTLYNNATTELLENSKTIANVSDDVYSATSDGTNVWLMSKTGTTATKLYHYPAANTGLVETSGAIDTDVGASGDEQDNDVDITCPSVTNCKIVYIDLQDDAAPDLMFVDCDNADCSTTGSGTPRSIDGDIGSGTEHDSNPAIFCLSSGANCKIVYGDNLDTTTPDVVMIDCNDDDCDTVTAGTVNSDVGQGTTPKVWAELYCIGDTDCQIVYLDNDSSSGSLHLADCSNAQCSTTNSNGAIQTNINNAQTTAYNLQMDIWCIASGDCRIIYQDGTNSDLSYLDCSSTACTGLTPQDIDTDIGGGTATSAQMAIDCTGGSSDCKMIYTDITDTALYFVDCDAAACTSPTITKIDDTAGNINFAQVSLDCSRGATDCKGTWVGTTTGGSERLYYFDCSNAACSTGSAIQLPSGAETRGAVACAATDDCKLAYFKNDTPTLRFADCTNATCTPDWESLTAPWSSETNVTSVSLTYNSSDTDLYAHIIKDSTEQAYYKSTDSTSISWSGETSWAFTAGDLGHISATEVAAGTGQVAVVLRQGSNFEFSKLPGFSISGICKQYDRSTDCSDDGSNEIKVAYNGSLQSFSDTTVDGSWSISDVTAPSSGNTVTIFINGESTASERATAVTKYDGSGNITGVSLYQRHLTIGSDDAQTVSNTEASQYDYSASSNDTDVIFEVNASDDLAVDNLGNYTDEVLYVLASNTYRPGSGNSSNVATHDVINAGTVSIDANTVTPSGSWTQSGTFTDTCSGTTTGTNASLVNFTSTSSSETLSGTLNSTSDFCKVSFNGSGGGWTIQDPMLVSSPNATDTFSVTTGTVTLGNGGGDHLDVRGRFNISSGATFKSMTSLAQGDSTLCNSDDICIEINANSSPSSCTNCTIENSGTFDIDKNVTVRFNSSASVESGLNNAGSGYLEIQGTQDDTGTDTGAASNTLREAYICANESWANDQHNNKYVRMMTGLARGRIYPISDTTASDSTNCATGTDDSIAINDTSSTTDSSPSVTCSSIKCVITLTGETIVTADNDHIGRYIHDKQGTEGYYLIVDSTESGSDTISVIGDPSTLALASNDDIAVVDGIRSADTFEILDYAEVTAHSTNQGFIHTASAGEMVMKYAKASELGAETSNKYGINGDTIWGSFGSEGFLVEKSYITNSHRAIRCISCSFLTSEYTNGVFDNYIVNTSQDAIDLSAGRDYEIAGNRIDTVTGNGRGVVTWNSQGSTIRDNIITNTGATYGAISSEASGTDGHNLLLYNYVYDAGSDGLEDIAGSQETIYAGNQVFSSASDGIELTGSGVGFQFAGNVIDVSGSDGVNVNTNATSNLIGYQETYGYNVGQTFSDLYLIGTGTYTANYFGSRFGSALEVDSLSSGEYLASFNHDSTNGVKYYNDYTIPNDNSTTPQNEGTVKMNYADNSWEDSFTPAFYDSINYTGSEDTNLSFAFSGGTLGGNESFYVYKVICNSASCGTANSNAWDVYRTGVSGQESPSKYADIGDATTGDTFTDGTTNVQFNIGDAGTDYARGDSYTFMVFQDAANTNTQKTLTGMDDGAVLTIGSGETLEMIGDPVSKTQSVKDSGSSTGYTMTLSGGTLNAYNYSFTGQSGTGLNLSSGTVSNLHAGSFDDNAGAGATYITVAAAILNAGAQVWDGMYFDPDATDPNVDKNVTLSGSPSACSNSWTFNSGGNLGGTTNGEANDTDPGDAGICNNSNGYVLWGDVGPSNDQLLRHGEWFNASGMRLNFTF